MKFRSKNLLVTGGSGFIGSNFIEFLFQKYKSLKIYNLDLLTYAGKISNTDSFNNNPNYKFFNGDICDKNLVDSIFSEYSIDGVINFAAESHVDNSIINPEKFIQTNIMGVYNLLNISKKYWMKSNYKVNAKFKTARFHQISTDEVYGSINEGSFNESCKYNPNSPYSSSKASADMMVRSFNKTYGLNTTTTICSNNYGKNQHIEKFIPKIINSSYSNMFIPVYGDGLNIRDWLHVDDHCQAIDLVFNNSCSGSVYNVGANNELSNLELIDVISSIFKNKYNIKNKIKFISERPGHDRRYSLDISKIEKEFSWKPKNQMVESLEKIIELYCK